ncbi:unnamed protein product [Closterium sp. NIES-65]|nr:unnamed protein product [Closterium sp. NIES-65]
MDLSQNPQGKAEGRTIRSLLLPSSHYYTAEPAEAGRQGGKGGGGEAGRQGGGEAGRWGFGTRVHSHPPHCTH